MRAAVHLLLLVTAVGCGGRIATAPDDRTIADASWPSDDAAATSDGSSAQDATPFDSGAVPESGGPGGWQPGDDGVQCYVATDCETLLGPLPVSCSNVCPNGPNGGCEHYLC